MAVQFHICVPLSPLTKLCATVQIKAAAATTTTSCTIQIEKKNEQCHRRRLHYHAACFCVILYAKRALLSPFRAGICRIVLTRAYGDFEQE